MGSFRGAQVSGHGEAIGGSVNACSGSDVVSWQLGDRELLRRLQAQVASAPVSRARR